ncbi:MAG: OmpA family protein [Bacteroidetes bacterium]|nr:OmpA family protein [Bacteroidota bacterium]
MSFPSVNTYAQKGQPVVLISGRVVNARNMEPIGSKVTYETLPEGAEAGIARSDPSNGNYKIILPRGKKYGYYALAEGFYSETKFLDVTTLEEYEEIDEQNLFLAPVELDQEVRLNNIFFSPGSADLKAESLPELDRFVQFLKINKKIEIEIAGHTDNSLSEEKSMELSVKKAQAVADYISKKGISEKRLTVNGYGSAQPIGFNNTDEGREMNNRIMFKVLSLVKTK